MESRRYIEEIGHHTRVFLASIEECREFEIPPPVHIDTERQVRVVPPEKSDSRFYGEQHVEQFPVHEKIDSGTHGHRNFESRNRENIRCLEGNGNGPVHVAVRIVAECALNLEPEADCIVQVRSPMDRSGSADRRVGGCETAVQFLHEQGEEHTHAQGKRRVSELMPGKRDHCFFLRVRESAQKQERNKLYHCDDLRFVHAESPFRWLYIRRCAFNEYYRLVTTRQQAVKLHIISSWRIVPRKNHYIKVKVVTECTTK